LAEPVVIALSICVVRFSESIDGALDGVGSDVREGGAAGEGEQPATSTKAAASSHGAARRSMCASLTDSLPSAVLHQSNGAPNTRVDSGSASRLSTLAFQGEAFRR
jgi:hypothetical protein